VVDGGGLTKVTPSTVGDTEGLTVVVGEVVDAAVADGLAVTDGLAVPVVELVAVAVTEGLVVVGEPVGEGLAGHALPPGLFPAKSLTAGVGDGLTRGLSGIGGSPAGKPGLAVTVITIVSDTCVPCACAFAPKDTVAAPAATALSTNVTTEARTLAVCGMARRGGMISVRC
jgi:hypothetical protein